MDKVLALKKSKAAMAPTPRLALITVAGTLAYIGLAILDWGGFARLLPPRPDRSYNPTIRPVWRRDLSGGNLSPGVREDRANRWVIIAFGLIGLLAAYLPAIHWPEGVLDLDGDAIRWLGVVLFAAGGARCGSGQSLCWSRFSGLVAIQPGHKLVTSGVYGVIRHPSYLGLLVTRWDGRSLFVRGRGMLTVLLIPPLLARIVLKSGCCVRSSAANTCLLHPHVAAHSQALFKQAAAAGQSYRRRYWGADGRSSRKHFGARWPQDAPWSAFWGGRAVSLANSATLAEFPICTYTMGLSAKVALCDAA